MDKVKNRSARIAQQLGMPHGTATNRLRKLILFSLLVKLKENICSVCKQEISCVDELSIEHTKPWEGRSAELFWDLNNIVFSHTKCNRQHVFHGWRSVNLVSQQRKAATDGGQSS